MAAAALGLLAPSLPAQSGKQAGNPWPPHVEDGVYYNLDGAPDRGPRLQFLRFLLQMVVAPDPETIPDGHVLSKAEVRAGIDAAAGADSVTWIGHACHLLRLGGKRILTDPFLSDWASPVPGLGPKRWVPPALDVDELPPIDAIVVSHNHYDHLDARTIEAFPDRDVNVVVPLGLGEWFRSFGYGNVVELDWGEAWTSDGLSITSAPAVHFSRRTPFDMNRSLWAGYAIAAGGRNVYFAGDTGWNDVFGEIGRRHGPFDLALVPIGAYAPRSVMRASHVNPEEAARIARDVGAASALGMHWGTVTLTLEPHFEPPDRFLRAMQREGYAPEDSWVFAIGETRSLR